VALTATKTANDPQFPYPPKEKDDGSWQWQKSRYMTYDPPGSGQHEPGLTKTITALLLPTINLPTIKGNFRSPTNNVLSLPNKGRLGVSKDILYNL